VGLLVAFSASLRRTHIFLSLEKRLECSSLPIMAFVCTPLSPPFTVIMSIDNSCFASASVCLLFLLISVLVGQGVSDDILVSYLLK
jgi:hypothetical protein